MNDFLYIADNAGPMLTFNGEYRMRRHRDLEIRRRVAGLARAVSRRLPRTGVAATR